MNISVDVRAKEIALSSTVWKRDIWARNRDATACTWSPNSATGVLPRNGKRITDICYTQDRQGGRNEQIRGLQHRRK